MTATDEQEHDVEIRRTVATAAGIAMLAAGVAGASVTVPVLGAKAFAPTGGGFGRAHPTSFFNGDDEAGYVGRIVWRHWGAATADGVGRNPIFKPTGGYYSQQARIELRAHDLGRCPGSTRPAYRQLEFREPKRPGGPLGPWRSWTGGHDICTMP